MKLLKRSVPTSDDADPKVLLDSTTLIQEKCDVYLRNISTLLHCLKMFALDVDELHPERFIEEIRKLEELFKGADKPKRMALYFDNRKEKIVNFIETQQKYIKDREQELHDTIDRMAKAMANLNVENREFYEKINGQGEKIIEISTLDDIKKIKNALEAEIEQMWEIVGLKQDQEQRQIRFLANQVQTLQSELEATRSRAMTDSLTGVYNRQALNDFLAERIERQQMVPAEFSILMLDIDDFQTINDKYGHLIGDRVLVAVAQKCKNAIRGEDFIARYGGEEIAIVLERANHRNSLKKAKQICSTIASVRYATNESQTEDYLSVTVSIGVTQFKKGDTISVLIERADKALYDAKRKGKNCAVGRKS